MVTRRYLLAVAMSQGWDLHQMDIHKVFLYGDLNEQIYMKPPPGFRPPRPYLICKLKKSIYVLRQAPKQWLFMLVSALYAYGFQQSTLYHSQFTYKH